ncbi:hypothetical protein PT2222_110179 [Paraburkholderia tropica]
MTGLLDVVRLNAMGFNAGMGPGLGDRTGDLSHHRAPHDQHRCVNPRSFPVAIHSLPSHCLVTAIR